MISGVQVCTGFDEKIFFIQIGQSKILSKTVGRIFALYSSYSPFTAKVVRFLSDFIIDYEISKEGLTALKNIKWIFFDIGSTLVDESAVYENRIKEITQSNNIDINEFIEKVKQRAQTNLKPIASVAADYGAKVPAWRHDLETLYPNAKEILQRLSISHKLGVIANQDFGTEQRLTEFGIRQYFDLVIASAEEGVAKPDLRIFKIALDRAKCKPEEAVMVGDRLDNDIIPANKIGMKTVWIKQGFGSYAEPNSKEQQPDFAVNNLSELFQVFK